MRAKLCAVVKANAYGHGLGAAIEIAKFSDELACATIDEANELFEAGVTKPINILGCVDKSQKNFYASNIFPTVSSVYDIDFLRDTGFSGAVNVKINSGMNRIGVKKQEFAALLRYILRKKLQIKSAFTHFYDASDNLSTLAQFDKFMDIVLPYRNIIPQLHCCASNGLILPEFMQLDMCRVGIAIYGYNYANLLPAMTVAAPILQIFECKAGENIGYGKCELEKNCKVAAIRAGYGDGYRRKNAPRYVSVNNTACNILGQICMDITMVDVSSAGAAINDIAYLINDIVPAQMLAREYNTIVYEALTSFNSRARRVYFG